jgi:hypothetical protein
MDNSVFKGFGEKRLGEPPTVFKGFGEFPLKMQPSDSGIKHRGDGTEEISRGRSYNRSTDYISKGDRSRSRDKQNTLHVQDSILPIQDSFNVLDDRGNLIFGIGVFEPSNLDIIDELNETYHRSPYFSFRNMGVLINLEKGEFFLMSEKDEYKKKVEKINEEERQKLEGYRKEIIKNFFFKSKRFNIQFPQNIPFVLSFDHPLPPNLGTSRYHRDAVPTRVVLDIGLVDIVDNLSENKLGDYVFLEYEKECVSTTVKYEYHSIEHETRFYICPGSVLAVNNKLATHTTPYNMTFCEGAPNRELGNECVLRDVNSDIERSLRRTIIKHITPDIYSIIIGTGKVQPIMFSDEERSSIYQTLSEEQPFESIVVGKYLESTRNLEIGGRKRKRKVSKKKLLKKKKKSIKKNNNYLRRR